MDKAYLVREVKSFLMDEDGVGVIELVLILVEIFTPQTTVYIMWILQKSGKYITVQTGVCMMYNGDCEVYIIRYFNVWFYLFAKTETDNYKIKMLGEHISAGNSMKMKDIDRKSTRLNSSHSTSSRMPSSA